MITLDEHNEARDADWQRAASPARLGIECPECGSELVNPAPGMILTSWPPQVRTECTGCDYQGYARA